MRRVLAFTALLALAGLSGAEPATLAGDDVSRYLRGSNDSVSNLRCGIPPIPPIGCKVGPCVCDQSGENCQWTFVCR